jgi:hypothetical protein
MVTRAADLRADTRPIDKDVKVPQAVQRAAAAAEALQRAAYPDQTPAPEPTPPPPAGDTIVIADPPPAAPQPPAPQPAPQPPAPVTPPGNEPPAPQLTPEAELEVQRVRSEEGRRRKTLENQLSAANDRLASLESLVQELRNARPVAPPTPPAPPAPLITEQERNEFGTEMLDVMGRRAREIVSPELAELRSMMQSIEQKVTGTVQQTAQQAREAMLTKLDQALPEWRGINVQNEFKAWLALPNPYASGSRLSALTQAYEQNDTGRVLNFFKGFISELAAEDPATPPTPAPATPPAPPKPGLESLAAPGRARTSAQPNAPAEKQIITTADVNAFYDAVRKGYYNGREAEKNALEQELFAAQREGRVRAV